uniref:Folliculin n=1 Tax=Graphocephala atropunctata TaxID=36148 RepID=A0A1B6KXM4_9HEMI
MSFVISLCHFCDLHGPSVLLTCYSAQQEEELLNSNDVSCQACSMPEKYVSVDRFSESRHVSCRLPVQRHSLVSWLTHVCVRSLSCELNPCVFSEPPNCALSVSFSVRDAKARGFYHWLSIVVSSRDLALLAASWPFLARNIHTIVNWLQDKATQVYNMERPFRGTEPSQSRPLTQLVKSKVVYARLHCWFAWMIQACNSRLAEIIPRCPFYRLQPRHVFEEGNLKSLRTFLTAPVFDLAVLNVLEGRQVIVRGDIPALVLATVLTLKSLLPGDWCRTVPESDEYLEPRVCGLLGVSTQVAVPRPCQNIVRVDLVQGSVSAKTTAILPAKCPTLASKILKALGSDLLRGKALTYHLQAFLQEWTHIAKLVHLTRMENAAALLVSLGVKPQDQQLISYWSKNLSKS